MAEAGERAALSASRVTGIPLSSYLGRSLEPARLILALIPVLHQTQRGSHSAAAFSFLSIDREASIFRPKS